ncbi:hypothetical protein B7494_g3428 [Chlorociboria aeruginascens]|nr:hypothetical protein B7494_g3428 [Chlorociboria aeruginascens]
MEGEGEREREGRGGGVLGKRRRGGEESSGEEEIDEEVQRIPMPRDTPPPFSKEVLDAWYAKRRERAAARNSEGGGGGGHGGGGANQIPLGQNDRRARLGLGLETRDRDGDGKKEEEKIERPKLEAKTVYEAKPAIRDLRKEAITFVPAAVRVKIEKGKGVGGLVEPEEADRLEIEGYLGGRKNQGEEGQGSRTVQIEEVDDEEG